MKKNKLFKMEKRLLIIPMLLIFQSTFAQIGIGTSQISNSSVLLEFGKENKGIILPTVVTAPDNASDGTFIVNKKQNTIQVKENNNWTNLTTTLTTTTDVSTTGEVGTSIIIGAPTTSKPGVLVLESNNKALVLPHVENPHLNISKPVAGTMVYDTTSDALAIYDGTNWNYWK
ncbi:hypothetical protein [Chryseobacterium oryctis]|uniref:Uncharacterized protein n=1 Tax=Chryseobacterium oryctis TaxID=2952618 RepID=A0ABT3HQ59_9FLAO|nr:hypothetical protein [Chryseobacterium oryctis]MCW3161830.1 hypothetical protein [Chryseobacterium oryctis]